MLDDMRDGPLAIIRNAFSFSNLIEMGDTEAI